MGWLIQLNSLAVGRTAKNPTTELIASEFQNDTLTPHLQHFH